MKVDIKKFLRSLLVILVAVMVISNSPIFGADKTRPKIKIFSWWGYLDYDNIRSKIAQSCQCEISVDTYYTSQELLRRINNQTSSHDIIIFTESIYDIILDSLKTNISAKKLKYHPVIQREVDKIKYPENFRLFALGNTVLLYNKKSITIDQDDTFFSIVKKSRSKIISVLDDYMESNLLIGDIKKISEIKPYLDKTELYFTNNPVKIVNEKNFSWSVVWSDSGQKWLSELKNPDLDLAFISKLSYTSKDLITLQSDHLASRCVFNYLSSEDVLKSIHQRLNYISPFGPVHENNKYEKMFFDASHHQWIARLDKASSMQGYQDWQIFKANFKKHNLRR